MHRAPQARWGRRGPWVSEALGILALMLCSGSGHGDYSPEEGALAENGPGGAVGEEPKQPAGFSEEGQAIPVFIHMDTEYSLPCSPKEMHVENPTYRWARNKLESNLLLVDARGALTFQHFQGGSSGNYSCTVSYTEHKRPRAQTFHYTVQAYHVRGGLEALLVFRSRLCQEALKQRFLWSLQEALSRVASAQHCRLVLSKSSCFPTLQEPWDEFNLQVQFQVSPFGPEWDKSCNPHNQTTVIDCYHTAVRNNVLQAKLAMTRFLGEHGPFPITGAGAPRTIFTNRFTSFLKMERCARGYGLSLRLEACPDCCILCPPGTFSAPQSNECTTCPVGTFNPLYGMAACSTCKQGLETRAAGATAAGDCVEAEVPLPLRIPVMVLLILLPPLGCSCLIILACFWCHRCRQKRRQSPRGLARTGTATATAAAARAPRAPCAAWLHKAAAAARKAFRRARPASAGDVLQDRARGPDMAAALAGSPSYVNVGPAAAAPADNTYSLASNPYELPDSVETPRASYMTMGPAAAAPAGKTLYLASSHSYATVGPPTAAPAGKALPLAGSPTYVNMAPNAAAPAGKALPLAGSPTYVNMAPHAAAPAGKTLPLARSPSYAAVAPDAAAPTSKTLPLASSPYARPGRVETPRAFYTAAAPHVAASASWPLPPAAIAGAGMEQAPGGSYAAGAPDAAASRDTLPLGASASALAGVLGSPARAPGAAAASETIPLGASLEDLPPPPSPAKEPSDREFVFPSPPAFSPAGSRGSMRLPS
ncbi:uncharacterized protein LOC112546236 isoform X2 [Pelodiscus sinensis]|uniref:uncharacterized protein LOC112546236 isoform X2 n=1 Tax=Pelodiscus sinensis TaxID=13735 RepID=UPI003F6D3452